MSDRPTSPSEPDNEHRVPTSYEELISILEALPTLVREKRRRDRLTLRGAGERSGIGFNTLSRVEQGEQCSLSNALRLLHWVAEPSSGGGAVAKPEGQTP